MNGSVAVLAMMGVWKVGMGMNQRFVPMPMCVFGARFHWKFMFVPMMFVMTVFVAMFHFLMVMLMFMPFSKM